MDDRMLDEGTLDDGTLDEGTLDVERLAAGLMEQTTAVADAVEGMGPDAPVPTCPEWRLRDLVGHLGQADRWAADIVRTGEATAVPDPREADPGEPAAWRDWLLGGAHALLDALHDTGPETTVWTYLGPGPAAFWLRRMTYDTCVHHADAAFAAGTTYHVAPDLAAGAMSEVFGLLCAPGVEALKPAVARLRGGGKRLRWAPVEWAGSGWLVTRTPEGPRCERVVGPGTGPGDDGAADTDTDADVTVAGPVRDLLLVLTRRVPADHPGLTITGDSALLRHWLAHAAL
ncbi:maleylpyruvate isomerase family mycothiol-dependent enzyme [Streptomyces sp. 4N509B]|uniref:maleylpyruvate isomerase family mycothiol-dependent enzyme n=1 Tax=Streptomyces sp. 4N509B TaxID=3457413 RepID=UPI003FD2F2EF